MEIKQVKIGEIKPYEKNPRKNDKAVDIVAKSIKEFGFRVPIILDKDNIIIAGHTRLKAAIKLELKEVPIIWAKDLTPEQVKAFRIMDNKSTEFSEWDMNLLKGEFYNLEDTDYFNSTGFTTDEITKIWDKEVEEDNFELPKEPKYKVELGDMWQLCEHRLLCGDCTIKSNVDKLMGESKADMVFTDPPYGLSIVQTSGQLSGKNPIHGKVGVGVVGVGNERANARNYREIIGDDKPFDPSFLLNLSNKLILFGANNYCDKLPVNPHWLVWDKHFGAEGLDHCYFGDAELLWTNINNKSVRIYRTLWKGMLREGNRNIELKDYSKDDGEIILDLFGGSGSTLIACEQLNRKCFMMEIDPYYVSIIIKRWEKLTDKKATKVDK